jgi:D-alanyl-D-alanine carboxypeptidase (penicillin-binding protein 5/6)
MVAALRFALPLLIALAIAHAPPLFAQTHLAPTPPTLAAKSWLLLDATSGQVLTAQESDQRIEPASLTKLMTAYLTFSALRQKTLSLEQQLNVSERAWKQDGSRMFIDPKQRPQVQELIQGMIVQSGNDACVALAEAIAGSEEKFAELMTREAQRLGMKNTSFRNSTGLPDPNHFTTARDLSLLANAMVRDFPEEYARYYSQKEYRYNNITQPNRNRLLYVDPSVDGMKTGFTEAAGYCLISSAKRGPRRLISVVLGTASDNARAAESQKLLEWGYQAFDAVRVFEKGQAATQLRIYKGTEQQLPVGFKDDLIVAVPKGQAASTKAELIAAPLMAPVAAGARVGTVRVSAAGAPVGDYPILALKEVPLAGFLGRIPDTVRLWFVKP